MIEPRAADMYPIAELERIATELREQPHARGYTFVGRRRSDGREFFAQLPPDTDPAGLNVLGVQYRCDLFRVLRDQISKIPVGLFEEPAMEDSAAGAVEHAAPALNDGLPDAKEMTRGLEMLGYTPVVLVARKKAKPPKRTTFANRFDTVDAAVAAATAPDTHAFSWYVHRNRVKDNGRLYVGKKERFPVGHGDYANPPRIEDVAELEWLPIDLDPGKKKNVDPEVARAFAQSLLEKLAAFVPLYYTMDSGRGMQAAVRLAKPALPDTPEWDAALALAKRIEAWLKAQNPDEIVEIDPISNPNRFVRLAGSVNLKTGRVARIVSQSRVTVTNPAELLADVDTKKPRTKSRATHVVLIPRDPAKVESLDQLPDAVPDWCRDLIVQGHQAGEYKSRSEALFAVACALVRAGCDDATMSGVLTNTTFGISESIYCTSEGRQRPDPESYAHRQIQSAHDAVIAPELLEINDRYAVVLNIGGKCRVVEEVDDFLGYDDTGKVISRPRLTVISFSDFKNAYSNRSVEIPSAGPDELPRRASLAPWWLKHSRRRQFDRVDFAPGEDLPRVYNLWRGFACEPKSGDTSLFLAHARENICAGDRAHFDYLLGWMARAVQSPASPGESAIVLRGGQGVGKSFFAKAFGALFGPHFMQVADAKFLVGSFNWHLRDSVVLFADEAFFAPDPQHRSVLKALVTESLRVYEKKGIDAETGPNFTHLIMASNSKWVVPAEIDDRRFFVLDVADSHKRDYAYFAAIQHQLDGGGREALLHMLLNHDLSGFNVRDVPRTTALDDQKERTLPPVEYAWLECLREGELPIRQVAEGGYLLPTASFRRHILSNNPRFSARDASFNAIATFLGRPPRRGESRRKHMGFRKLGGTPRGWLIPELPEARARWDEAMWPVAWDSDAGEEGESDADVEVRLARVRWNQSPMSAEEAF